MPGKRIRDHQVLKYKQHHNQFSQVAAAVRRESANAAPSAPVMSDQAIQWSQLQGVATHRAWCRHVGVLVSKPWLISTEDGTMTDNNAAKPNSFWASLLRRIPNLLGFGMPPPRTMEELEKESPKLAKYISELENKIS